MTNESKWLVKLRNNKGSAECQVQSVGGVNTEQSPLRDSALFEDEQRRIPQWLEQQPFLIDLITRMYHLAVKYNLDVAGQWPGHRQDTNLGWHQQAMASTYEKLNHQDKESVIEDYELLKILDGFVNWYVLLDQGYPVELYILDKYGRRVCSEGQEVTTCHILPGNSKEEALETIDTKSYEFKAWL